jgi:hypothetical protein
MWKVRHKFHGRTPARQRRPFGNIELCGRIDATLESKKKALKAVRRNADLGALSALLAQVNTDGNRLPKSGHFRSHYLAADLVSYGSF